MHDQRLVQITIQEYIRLKESELFLDMLESRELCIHDYPQEDNRYNARLAVVLDGIYARFGEPCND